MADNCIFCKIGSGEIPSNFIYEDDRVVAFRDIDPQAPEHILIIPKAHYDSILNVEEGDLIAHIHKITVQLAKELGLDEKGFRIVNNCGEDGGQSVPHLHFHLLGGRAMGWPPG